MLASLIAAIVLSPAGLTLPNATGGKVELFTASKKPRVLLFVTTECPICRQYSPEMKRLFEAYGKRVDFFAVHVDPSTKGPAATSYGKQFGLNFPALLDSKQAAAQRLDLAIVPTAAVFDATGKARYIGRIDDRFPKIGIQKKTATRRDLKIAIDEVLAGKTVSVPKTKAVGCVMPYIGD